MNMNKLQMIVTRSEALKREIAELSDPSELHGIIVRLRELQTMLVGQLAEAAHPVERKAVETFISVLHALETEMLAQTDTIAVAIPSWLAPSRRD